jgi:hypothetical protein
MILVSSLFIFLGTISYVLAESSSSNSTSTTTGNAPLSMSKISNTSTLSEMSRLDNENFGSGY